MAYISKRTGKEVDELLDKVERGGTGGGGNSDNNYTDADKALVQTIPHKVDYDTFNDSQEYIEREIEGLNEHISEVDDRIANKANKEGYYPDMSVGMADNLVGRGDVQDAQINFRPSAGADNITDGVARIERIKGNSVVWNQLAIKSNVSIVRDNSANESAQLYNIYECSEYLVVSRWYYIDVVKNNVTGVESIRYGNITSEDTNVLTLGKVVKCQASAYQPSISFAVRANTTSTGTITPIIIDLTQMFGAGNEPTTVEEYLQRKPMNIEDEFAHNEGELIDMKVDRLVSVSDNAYDYTKGYARVMGGYKYDITANAGATLEVSFYADGEDDNEERDIAPDSEGKYTFPANGICYVNGDFASGRDVCVCLNHSYDKPHPAYQQVVKDLSWIWEIQDSDGNLLFPNGMRSAGSAFDEIRFNPTKKVWEAVKRIGEVDLGKADWYIVASYGGFYASYIKPTPKTQFQGFCAKYPFKGAYSNVKDGESGWIYTSGFFVKDSNYTDAASLKASLDGVMLYYELAEPIVVELDYPTAETNMDYMTWDFGTEEAIASVPSAPFRADIQYGDNFVDDIRKNKEDIATNKANIAKNTSALNSKQDTLTITTKPNGNIVIGNLVIDNIAGQSKEFMPATPSGDPMHYVYLTKKFVRWGEFEHNGITYGKEGYWSIWAELGGLDDITTAEMRQIWEEKRSISTNAGAFAYTVARTNIINNDSSLSLFYSCAIPSGFRSNSNLVVANLVCVNNISVKCTPRDVNDAFNGCYKLKKILVGINLTYCSATNNVFNYCRELEDVLLENLKTNISFAWSPLLSKESLLYMINNCASNATFTITLHPDVYAKCITGGEWYVDLYGEDDTSDTDGAIGEAKVKGTTISIASA